MSYLRTEYEFPANEIPFPETILIHKSKDYQTRTGFV